MRLTALDLAVSPAHAARVALTLAVGAAAAVVCVYLATPLPWMIGPLLASAAGTLAGAPLAASRRLRNAGQWAIGTALGLYFTPAVVAVVASHGVAIVAGIAWALALGAGFAAFLRKLNPTLDAPTAFFASAIGGASEMAVLAERHGGRVDLVATAHSLRIVIVVVAIPFAVQWAGLSGVDPTPPSTLVVHLGGLALLVASTVAAGALAQRIGISNPWVLGPLGAAFAYTASGIELSALPAAASSIGQLFIGVALGTRFTPGFMRSAPRWLACVAVGTLAMIVASAAFAWAVAQASGLHPATVLLGTSPGGIAEMCITAQALRLGVPVVTAFHVTRMVAVIALADPLFRWSGAR